MQMSRGAKKVPDKDHLKVPGVCGMTRDLAASSITTKHAESTRFNSPQNMYGVSRKPLETVVLQPEKRPNSTYRRCAIAVVMQEPSFTKLSTDIKCIE